LIRFGEMTKDELFVSAGAAKRGVVVKNRSDKENLVMLRVPSRGHRQACSPSCPHREDSGSNTSRDSITACWLKATVSAYARL
jgi:hypothetical protein